DFIHEVGVERKGAAVVVNPVDTVVVRLVVPLTSEDMHLMSAALEGRGQLGHVNAHAAHGDGVQSFPGKQGDSHASLLSYIAISREVGSKSPSRHPVQVTTLPRSGGEAITGKSAKGL